MIDTLFNQREKIIYTLLQQKNEASKVSLLKLSQDLHISPRMVQRQIKLWCDETRNKSLQLQNQLILLPNNLGKQFDIYLLLLQQNTSLQLLWHLIEFPYTSCCALAKEYHCSSATLRRQIVKLQHFLAPYQIQLSFSHAPVIKGCEFQIRWLGWFLSLISDPPFDWFSPEELLHRFEEVQQLRIQTGHSLNHSATHELTFSHFPYQVSERAWLYLGHELLTFQVPLNILENSPLFSLFHKKERLLRYYIHQQEREVLDFLVAEETERTI